MLEKIKKLYFVPIAIALIVAGYFIGKKQAPAKVETKIEYVEKEVIKTVYVEKQASAVRKASKVETKPDGSSTELSLEEALFSMESEAYADISKDASLKQDQKVKNALFRVRIGGITKVDEFIKKAQVMGLIGYGYCDAVAHSDMKQDHWIGGACGFDF